MSLTKSEKIAKRNVNYPVTELENYLVRDYRMYLDKIKDSVIILGKKGEHEYKFVDVAAGSRYFDEGRKRISRRIYASLGHNAQVSGVFLTLTVSPKLITRELAWKEFGSRISNFIDLVNVTRKRKKGFQRRLSYFWVIEEQVSTGYPHVHIFFPELKWLYQSDELARMWGLGFVKVQYKTVSIAHYIISYMKKIQSWTDLGLSYIWAYKRRIYSISKKYRHKVVREISRWVMVGIKVKDAVLMPLYDMVEGKEVWYPFPLSVMDQFL